VKLAILIARYGYGAILTGAFLEGETIVVLAGYLARRGVLHLWAVILVAFAGSFAGDQLAYFVGRFWGEAVMRRRPAWRPGVLRVHELFVQRGTWLLVGFRFLYGLRNLVPFAVGMSRVPPRRFAPLNLIGAAIWAPAIATAGYEFGAAVERVLSRARSLEGMLFGVIIAVAIGVWVFRKLKKRSRPTGDHPVSGA
jgi:membrane protein DedA with SNARE-associated domain